jgi:hypothetical protein
LGPIIWGDPHFADLLYFLPTEKIHSESLIMDHAYRKRQKQPLKFCIQFAQVVVVVVVVVVVAVATCTYRNLVRADALLAAMWCINYSSYDIANGIIYAPAESFMHLT